MKYSAKGSYTILYHERPSIFIAVRQPNLAYIRSFFMVKRYLDLAEEEAIGCIIGTPGQKFPGAFLCFFSILLHMFFLYGKNQQILVS